MFVPEAVIKPSAYTCKPLIAFELFGLVPSPNCVYPFILRYPPFVETSKFLKDVASPGDLNNSNWLATLFKPP